MSSTVEPSVHFLAFKDGNPSPDRFRVLWQLVDLQDKPLTSISDGDGSKEIMKGGFHLAEGDLVVFPSLLSGGGKFESMRFVGPKSTLSSTGDDVFPLLSAGIETPEFPTIILSLAQDLGISSLKDIYEAPFNAILQQQSATYNLREIFSSDDDAYNQFWEEPPIARRRGPPSGDPFLISLGECIWIKTLDGKSLRVNKGVESSQDEL